MNNFSIVIDILGIQEAMILLSGLWEEIFGYMTRKALNRRVEHL